MLVVVVVVVVVVVLVVVVLVVVVLVGPHLKRRRRTAWRRNGPWRNTMTERSLGSRLCAVHMLPRSIWACPI